MKTRLLHHRGADVSQSIQQALNFIPFWLRQVVVVVVGADFYNFGFDFLYPGKYLAEVEVADGFDADKFLLVGKAAHRLVSVERSRRLAESQIPVGLYGRSQVKFLGEGNTPMPVAQRILGAE